MNLWFLYDFIWFGFFFLYLDINKTWKELFFNGSLDYVFISVTLLIYSLWLFLFWSIKVWPVLLRKFFFLVWVSIKENNYITGCKTKLLSLRVCFKFYNYSSLEPSKSKFNVICFNIREWFIYWYSYENLTISRNKFSS